MTARTRFVADFVGSSNVLPPEMTQALGGPPAGPACAPRRRGWCGPGPACRGTVTALRYLGPAPAW
jgi:putative spermidine/putrescine transport system ATP-binding protein